MVPHTPRILIVEDETLVAMLLEIECQRSGYQILESVATGEEAVSLVQQDAPDILLMDIHLAGKIDGIETTRQIQAFADIPVIFMTSYSDQATMERARTLHPAAYITKPICLTELADVLNSVRKVALAE